MTAADYKAIAADAEQATQLVEGVTEQVILRGILDAAEAFDYNKPLPTMPDYKQRPWETQ